jgi:hypothetical protein
MVSHTECGQHVKALYSQICGKDTEALAFLCQLDKCFEDFKAFTLGDAHDPQRLIGLMATVNMVFSLPFYVKNAPFLYLVVQRGLGVLTTGCPMAEIAIGISTLKSGFETSRELLPKLRELCAACETAHNVTS